jgi:hypothetical protein
VFVDERVSHMLGRGCAPRARMIPCLNPLSPVLSASARGSQGTFSDAGDVFICVQCQADANDFLRIQDDIWPSTGESPNKRDRSPTP